MAAETTTMHGWLPYLRWMRHTCPRCNCDKFKLAELRPIDNLIGLLLLKPFRCTWCWRRYYWFSLRADA